VVSRGQWNSSKPLDGSSTRSYACFLVHVGIVNVFVGDDVAATSAFSALICGCGRLVEELSVGITFGWPAGVGRPKIAVGNLWGEGCCRRGRQGGI
jgi:hypothetical protein